MKPRLLLVDDLRYVAESGAALLRETGKFEEIKIATSRQEAERLTRQFQPHVILMDVKLPDETEGIDALRAIREIDPGARVIMLSIYRQPLWVAWAREAGAMGYLLKSASGEEVLTAIDQALQGRPTPWSGDPDPLIHRELTAWEVRVLRLAARGMKNEDIAKELKVTLRAVKGCFSEQIFYKLAVDNRVEAIRRARELGYLPPEPAEPHEDARLSVS